VIFEMEVRTSHGWLMFEFGIVSWTNKTIWSDVGENSLMHDRAGLPESILGS
jgi:hypothetical protein